MVFDVESIGLHGEGFAVAYVVVNHSGQVLEEACLSCDPWKSKGKIDNRNWVMEHIPYLNITNENPIHLRSIFWKAWHKWKGLNAFLVSDCGWPVEARFLCDAVDDSLQEREWDGPYPLLDLGSILFAKGMNPLESNTRLPEELPEHHPLMDARQSARLLLDALFGVKQLMWVETSCS